MKSKAKMTKQEKEVKDWNDRYPVGQRVKVLKDSGELVETYTRSEAQVLSGHTAVIWLKGISGCYMLSRVKALEG